MAGNDSQGPKLTNGPDVDMRPEGQDVDVRPKGLDTRPTGLDVRPTAEARVSSIPPHL